VDSRARNLMAGLTAMLEKVNSGGTGLPAIADLLATVQEGLGAQGSAASEYTTADGRVIAAQGLLAPFVGIRFDGMTEHAKVVRSGPGVYAYDVDDIQPMAGQHLSGFGIKRLLVAAAEADGRVIGNLVAVFGADQRLLESEDETLIMRLAGAVAAHFYTDRVGLPILGDGDVSSSGGREVSERGLFVAMASHELRTPVTVIKGYADTLTDHWDALDTRSRMEAIRVIGQRSGELARLVDRLLASSVGGVGEVHSSAFDLTEALRAAAAELPAHLRRRLSVALPGSLPTALGNRADIVTVLTELVTNADKYSGSAEPITLTAGQDGRTVYFRVSDRGIGVRPDEVEMAFERYWQGGDRGSARRPGVGLGLYLVRKTIERQNGWVSLRPRDGGGTVAEVRLPRGDR
jgi:two-component system, OmpR family, phosphate regulon sensor histidine kinase PhoR